MSNKHTTSHKVAAENKAAVKKHKAASNSKVSPARLIAFEVLRRVETEKAFASVLLAQETENLSAIDRALAHGIVLGVLRWQSSLDAMIEFLANRKLAKIDVAVKLALRIGLYQIKFLARVPDSAAVNESVALVRRARLASAASLTNAVLRRAARTAAVNEAVAKESAAQESVTKESVARESPEGEKDFVKRFFDDELKDLTRSLTCDFERLAVETAHPAWMLKRWSEAFGLAEARELAAANNRLPPVAFRIVTEDVTAQVLDELGESGATFEESKIAAGAWRIKKCGGAKISGISGKLNELAARGKIYLQDEASQLIAPLLEAKAGMRVLDVCAAPGSKTTHLRALVPNLKLLAAGDIHAHRLRLLQALANRQQLHQPSNDAPQQQHHHQQYPDQLIAPIVYDAAQNELPFKDESFDVVLVDAPCSGTGTLRHNPEIKWRLQPADVDLLAAKQARILRHAARCVRAGGKLIYSTCSVEPEENEIVVQSFLADRKEWRLISNDLTKRFAAEVNLTTFANKNAVEHEALLAGTGRTFPHRHDTDGFFFAVMIKD